MPRRRRPNPLLWVLLGLGLCAAVAAGLGGLVWVAVRTARQPAGFTPPDRSADRREAAEVFRGPAPPAGRPPTEFDDFFARLAAAAADPAADMTAFVAADRMFDEVKALGGFAGTFNDGPAGRRSFVADTMTNMPGHLRTYWTDWKWTATVVRTARPSADGSDAVVVATHEAADGPRYKYRWWLTRRPAGGWAVYDLENLEVGVRTLHETAAINVTIGTDAGRDAQFARTEKVSPAVAAVRAGQFARARLLLDEARGGLTGWPFDDNYDEAEAVYSAAVGDHAASAARLDALIARNPDRPGAYTMRAAARAHLGLHDGAAADAEAHLARLGPDADALAYLGFAREGQARPDDAVAAFHAALDEQPNHLLALEGLRRALPISRKAEAGDRLARAPRPETLFDALARDARSDADLAGLAAFAEGLHRVRPDHVGARVELIRARARAGRTADAVALYKSATADAKDDERADVLGAFVWAMASAGRHLEAYAAVPAADARAAYRDLAGDLDDDLDDLFPDDGDDPDPGYRKASATLAWLTAAHRGRDPDDPRPSLYAGRRHLRATDYAAAERVLAAGMARVPFADDADDDAASGYDEFRYERVRALFNLGRGLDAYHTLRPADETFEDLARLYRSARDAAGLRRLLLAHRWHRPADAAPYYWEAELHWDRKEYDPAVRLMRAYLLAVPLVQTAKYGWAAHDRYVRGLVRLGRPAEARAHVDAMEAPAEELQIVVRAAAGEHDAAAVLLIELCQKHKWRASLLYGDDDLAPHLKGDAYKAFRDQFPPPAPPKPAVTG